MFYAWPGVRKCWLSMLSTFNCFVIYSPLIKNFRWVKEVNVLDNIKCLQNIKNNKLFLREKVCSRKDPINPRVVNSIWLKISYKIFFLFNPQNNYSFSLHQKTSVEIPTARYKSYFNQKITEAYASQTDLLNLLVLYGELIDFQ